MSIFKILNWTHDLDYKQIINDTKIMKTEGKCDIILKLAGTRRS